MARIRIYSPFYPYPHTEAALQVVFNQILDCRSQGHDVELVTWKDAPDHLAQKRELSKPVWPRDVQVTSFYRPQGSVQFDRVTRVLKSLFSSKASPELYYYPPSLDKRSELAAVDLEIYHYSFAHSWLSNRPSLAAKSVVHMHNLEHRLFALRALEQKGPASVFLRLTSRKLRSHENELRNLTSEIWQISPADLDQFETMFGTSMQRTVPPSIDPESVKQRWTSAADSDVEVYKLGFIGGLNFGPNRESFLWILEHVAPLLQKQHSNKFEILHVGKSDDEIKRIASPYPFIRFLGFVPQTESWWQQLSYTMVPDVTAAGIRVKLLESLASKVPVLANTLAVSRIPENLQKEEGLFYSDSPAAWVEKIMSSQPFEERARVRTHVFPEGLLGREIYRFLNAGYFS